MNKDLLTKKLLRGGAWSFGGKVLALPTGILINALLARILDPKDLGAFFLIQSIIAIAAMIASFGVNKTIVKYISQYLSKNDLESIILVIKKTLLLIIGTNLFLSFLLLIGSLEWLSLEFFNSPGIQGVSVLIVIWVVVKTILQYSAEVFRGFNDIKNATIFGEGGISRLITFVIIAIIWTWFFESSLENVLLAFVISFLVGIAFSVSFIVIKIKSLSQQEWETTPKNSIISYREIIKYTWPIWITNIAFFFVNQGDLWVLGYFESQEKVALYGASLKLITLISVPLSIANAIVPPLVSEYYNKEEFSELEYTLRFSSTLTAIPSIIVFALFIIFGELILDIIYGAYYRESYMVLMILSVGGLAKVLGGSNGVTLMMTGYQRINMHITIFTGVITLVASIILVQYYSIEGLAISISAGYALNNLIGLWYVKRVLNVWTIPSFRIVRSFIKKDFYQIFK